MTRTPDGSHQGEPIGPTLQRGATMAERYRDHLIFVRAVLDPERHLWTVSAHIQPWDFSGHLATQANRLVRNSKRGRKLYGEASQTVDRR